MDAALIRDMLFHTCVPLRKGAVETVTQVGPMQVTTIDAFPSLDEMANFDKDYSAADGTIKLVDCHFLTVAVHLKRAEQCRAEFIETIEPDAEMLRGGPSYLSIGALLDDQTTAFGFMALGDALGLWHVVTPEKLHLPQDSWDRAAGLGYVLISGYNKGNDNGRDSGGAPVSA